jgi:hypothetical protein
MLRDTVDKFDLPDTLLKNHPSEDYTLRFLWEGLEYLCTQVRRCEQEVAKTTDAGCTCFEYGNLNPPRVPMGLVNCSFQWYAVSVCNFVRLVGYLRLRADADAPRSDEYLKRVLPEVKPWRDKVAAHPARTSHKKEDSLAEKEASIMPSVGLCGGVFYASPMTRTIRHGAKTSTSAALVPWSLTSVHEGLRTRFQWV